jgi:hypothetical protein
MSVASVFPRLLLCEQVFYNWLKVNGNMCAAYNGEFVIPLTQLVCSLMGKFEIKGARDQCEPRAGHIPSRPLTMTAWCIGLH